MFLTGVLSLEGINPHLVQWKVYSGIFLFTQEGRLRRYLTLCPNEKVGINFFESNTHLKLRRPEPQKEREVKMEKKEMTGVRHYRAESCRPRIRGEPSAEA